jgi:hypothetical protein
MNECRRIGFTCFLNIQSNWYPEFRDISSETLLVLNQVTRRCIPEYAIHSYGVFCLFSVRVSFFIGHV